MRLILTIIDGLPTHIRQCPLICLVPQPSFIRPYQFKCHFRVYLFEHWHCIAFYLYWRTNCISFRAIVLIFLRMIKLFYLKVGIVQFPVFMIIWSVMWPARSSLPAPHSHMIGVSILFQVQSNKLGVCNHLFLCNCYWTGDTDVMYPKYPFQMFECMRL